MPSLKRTPAENERQPRAPMPRDDRGFHVEGDGKHGKDGGSGGGGKGSGPRFGRQFWIVVVVLLVVNYALFASFQPGREPSASLPYQPNFLAQVDAGNVERIAPEGDTVVGEFKKQVRFPDKEGVEPTKRFETEIPTFADDERLEQTLREKGVIIDAEPLSDGPGLLMSVLLGFGPIILLVGLFIFLARRATGMGGKGGPLGQFSKSKARRVEASEQRVTFKDVAGIEEAKSELAEIVDFLKNPERYQKLGGRIPRGVLLSGEPGTGKTLLARAVAGEAGVPFFSISASEFVEAIVGVGASRVRDLFAQAKEAQPAIVFVDELDAVGRARTGGAGFGGGANDEREQTLNQILTEMDGFDSGTSVIVLAATNRPEILDKALMRPGRFDRRVVVSAPDKDGRRKILDVHTRSLPLGEDVDLDRVAASTPGMVGADLANLANEAALLAAKRHKAVVGSSEFADALEKVVLGAERSILLSDADRRRTAIHEAGHAVVGMLTEGADPVRKVSIIPRGQALGVTLSTPETDRVSYDENYLRGRIKVALGGRIAEELVFGDRTTGAESDLQQITQIATSMVARWGMSKAIGPITVTGQEGRGMLLPGSAEVSETTHRIVDEEVRRIVEELQEEVRELLTEHRAMLDGLADGLLEHETLDQDEAYQAAGLISPPSLHKAQPAGAKAAGDANGNGSGDVARDPGWVERPELPVVHQRRRPE